MLSASSSGTSNINALQGTTASTKSVEVDGMGGVGKTTLLKQLATDEQIVAKVPHGRFYMEFGRDATEQTVIKEIQKIVQHANGEKIAEQMRRSESLLVEIDRITELFPRKT